MKPFVPRHQKNVDCSPPPGGMVCGGRAAHRNALGDGAIVIVLKEN